MGTSYEQHFSEVTPRRMRGRFDVGRRRLLVHQDRRRRLDNPSSGRLTFFAPRRPQSRSQQLPASISRTLPKCSAAASEWSFFDNFSSSSSTSSEECLGMQQQTPIPPFPTSIGFFDADFSAADAGAFQRQLPPYAKSCLCSPPARMWSDPGRFARAMWGVRSDCSAGPTARSGHGTRTGPCRLTVWFCLAWKKSTIYKNIRL